MTRLLSAGIYVLSAVIGVAAFAYPFVVPVVASAPEGARRDDAPLLTLVLVVVCLVVLLIEVQGQVVSAKVLAALGVLVATTAVLRFAELAVPGPGGFSPVFAPVILAGFVFGARFGFLLGTLALLVSALITGGIGPWLPYQMFTAGWIGLTAGWLPRPRSPRLTLLMLVAFGALWGLLYGALTNLYFWPFFAGEAAMSWQSGLGWQEGLRRYAIFYAATSLAWDIVRALGNGLLIVVLGLPAIRALGRFRDRLQFQWTTA